MLCVACVQRRFLGGIKSAANDPLVAAGALARASRCKPVVWDYPNLPRRRMHHLQRLTDPSPHNWEVQIMDRPGVPAGDPDRPQRPRHAGRVRPADRGELHRPEARAVGRRAGVLGRRATAAGGAAVTSGAEAPPPPPFAGAERETARRPARRATIRACDVAGRGCAVDPASGRGDHHDCHRGL